MELLLGALTGLLIDGWLIDDLSVTVSQIHTGFEFAYKLFELMLVKLLLKQLFV